MTRPDTHTEHPQDVPPSLVELRAVKALLKACTPGWSWRFTRAIGPLDVQALTADTDGDGKRRKVTNTITVESIVGRGCHPGPPHRAVVALWIQRDGRWKLDTAWRGRHPDEQTPVELTATELTDYVATAAGTGDPDVELTLDLEIGQAA